MSITIEGKIEIPEVDFWEFVSKYVPDGFMYLYGIPKFNKENKTMDINFAASSETDPRNWVEKPACIKEWEN